MHLKPSIKSAILTAKTSRARTIEMRASLARVHAVVVVGLRDVQRGTVCLTAGFDGPYVEVLRLEVALRVDPLHSAGISEEDFEGGNLTKPS